MGRPELPKERRRSRAVVAKATAAEQGLLDELARLPNDKLATLFHVAEEPRFKPMTRSSVIVWLIRQASQRLDAERKEETAWAMTGQSLPTLNAARRLARLLGYDEDEIGEERFRSLARDAGIKGRRDRRGFRWSLANVDRVREYLDFLKRNAKT